MFFLLFYWPECIPSICVLSSYKEPYFYSFFPLTNTCFVLSGGTNCLIKSNEKAEHFGTLWLGQVRFEAMEFLYSKCPLPRDQISGCR